MQSKIERKRVIVADVRQAIATLLADIDQLTSRTDVVYDEGLNRDAVAGPDGTPVGGIIFHAPGSDPIDDELLHGPSDAPEVTEHGDITAEEFHGAMTALANLSFALMPLKPTLRKVSRIR